VDTTAIDDDLLDEQFATTVAVRAAVASVDTVDADQVDDPYAAATAEFYELLATAHWQRTGDELSDLLRDIDPAAGPIVDVGAGTGIGLPYLLSVSPDVEVYAIEPSKAMRTALHTRLLLDPRLTDRVTVDPRPLGRSLPERASAIVLSAVLGHLEDDERHRLWTYVAERMPTGAPTVVEVLPPYRPAVIEPVRYAAVPVGRFVYEGWQSGQPDGDRRMRWTMIYRVLHGRTVVSEQAVTSTYRCWSPDDVVAEVMPYGLTVTEHGDAVVVRRMR
jgi:phospholipid N-methyltransferase